MPKTTLTFDLTRPARKFGGDRYEHHLDGNKNDKVVVYVPQSISRDAKTDKVTSKIDITFEAK